MFVTNFEEKVKDVRKLPSGLSKSPLGFPGGSAGKESARSAGDLGSIPGLGSPWGRERHPLQCSGLENPTDCIVHGRIESDTTE